MHQQPTRWMFCDCGSTMQLDRASLPITESDEVASALCGNQADRYDAALAESNALICVACLQEAPFFTERAEERGQGQAARVSFLDVRDSAGWSDQAERARAENGGVDCGCRDSDASGSFFDVGVDGPMPCLREW